jgi:sugar lactone lactonase YvrE
VTRRLPAVDAFFNSLTPHAGCVYGWLWTHDSQGVDVTRDGQFVYVADSEGPVVRRVEVATGEVRTIAGMQGQEGAIDGIAGVNRFIRPNRVALDPTHTALYLTDVNSFSHRIRRVDLSTRTQPAARECHTYLLTTSEALA